MLFTRALVYGEIFVWIENLTVFHLKSTFELRDDENRLYFSICVVSFGFSAIFVSMAIAKTQQYMVGRIV